MNEIESLQALGFTGTEARLYATLARHGSLTGYEAAQRAGVARANAYPALDRLIRRGAVRAGAAGRSTRYEAVPVSEYADQRVRQLREAARRLEEALVPSGPSATASAGRGPDALLAKGTALLEHARTSAHLTLVPRAAARLREALSDARDRGTSVEVACLAGCRRPCPACGNSAHALPGFTNRPGVLVCRDEEEVLAADGLEDDVAFVVVRSGFLGHAVAALVEGAPPLTG